MAVFSELASMSIPMGPPVATTTAMLFLSDDLFNSGSQNVSSVSFDDRTPGAIPLESFSYSVTQKGSEPGGRPRSVESVEHGEFVCTRTADQRTPKLYRFVTRATYFTRATVYVFAEYPGQAEPYLIFSMTYVHVSSYKINLPSTSGTPTETISLKYGQMKIVGRGQNLPFNTYTMPSGDFNESFSQVMNIPGNILAGFGTTFGDKWIP